MREWQSQAHVKHYCRYHIVFVPKYRRKALYGVLRRDIGKIFRELCRQSDVDLVEGYAMRDHIHMLLMIPPKFSVSNTVGYLCCPRNGNYVLASQQNTPWNATKKS